jgi:hypothetical protein
MNIQQRLAQIFVFTASFFGVGQLIHNFKNPSIWVDFAVAVLWGISFFAITYYYKKYQDAKHQQSEKKVD